MSTLKHAGRRGDFTASLVALPWPVFSGRGSPFARDRGRRRWSPARCRLARWRTRSSQKAFSGFGESLKVVLEGRLQPREACLRLESDGDCLGGGGAWVGMAPTVK